MDELLRLLSDEHAAPIAARLCYEKLYEVRIINRAPIRVNYDGAFYYVCKNGITKDISQALVAGDKEAESIIMRACDRSLYTVTDTLKRGYISVRGGVRIGVCGSGVVSGGQLVTIKDFSSVNIRIPHSVTGCAAALAGRVQGGGGIANTLIASRPGMGKTTLLRDLCRLISNRGKTVLLCDEKYEIAAATCGVANLDVGPCTDIMSGVDKNRVFETAIAHMRPDVVLCDELFGDELKSVRRAVTCGVSVIASVHASSVSDIRKKPEFDKAFDDGVFDLCAVISNAPNRRIDIYEVSEL